MPAPEGLQSGAEGYKTLLSSQSERLDPRGEFIRHWLPELAGLERKAIHDPSSLGLFAGVDYPRPMVDLKASRERALAAFRNLPPRDGRA